MHKHSIHEGAKVLVVDDLLATGGTASATAQLVRRQGGYVASFAFVLELDFLSGRERLMPVPVVSLLHYATGGVRRRASREGGTLRAAGRLQTMPFGKGMTRAISSVRRGKGRRGGRGRARCPRRGHPFFERSDEAFVDGIDRLSGARAQR